jgi:hypothetical protein
MPDPTSPVDTPMWERLAPIGGVVFVVLDVVVAVAGGEPPESSASATEIARYYTDHAAGIEMGLWAFGIGAIALVFWFGGLWRWMVRIERGTPGLAVASLLGLSIAGSLALASSAIWANLALHLDAAGDGVVTMHSLGALLSSTAGIGIAAHLVATNLVGIGHRALPMWMAAIGLASAAGWIVHVIMSSTSPGGTATTIGLASFMSWCAWILCISYRLWTSRRASH